MSKQSTREVDLRNFKLRKAEPAKVDGLLRSKPFDVDPQSQKMLEGLDLSPHAAKNLSRVRHEELGKKLQAFKQLRIKGLNLDSVKGLEDVIIQGVDSLNEIADAAGDKSEDVLGHGLGACIKAGILKDSQTLEAVKDIAVSAGSSIDRVVEYGLPACAKAGVIKDTQTLEAVKDIAVTAKGKSGRILEYTLPAYAADANTKQIQVIDASGNVVSRKIIRILNTSEGVEIIPERTYPENAEYTRLMDEHLREKAEKIGASYKPDKERTINIPESRNGIIYSDSLYGAQTVQTPTQKTEAVSA